MDTMTYFPGNYSVTYKSAYFNTLTSHKSATERVFVAKDGILLQSESMKSAWLHHKGLHQHSKESPQKRHALCVSPMHVTHSVVVQYVLCVSLCLIIATILVLVFPSY